MLSCFESRVSDAICGARRELLCCSHFAAKVLCELPLRMKRALAQQQQIFHVLVSAFAQRGRERPSKGVQRVRWMCGLALHR